MARTRWRPLGPSSLLVALAAITVACGGLAHEGIPAAVALRGGAAAAVPEARQLQATAPVMCSFEWGSTGLASQSCAMWYNVQTGDDFDWTKKSGSTPSKNTGPGSAYDMTYYIYTEMSSPRSSGDRAILRTVPLIVSGQTVMKFKYYMYGASTGTLSVMVGGSGIADTVLWRQSGDKGAIWLDGSMDISSYAGRLPEISFVAQRGSSWSGDIAIDFVVFEAQTPPRASRPAPTPSPPTPAPTPAPLTPQQVPSGQCSFETSPTFSGACGIWHQEKGGRYGDNFDWTRRSGKTPSKDTGPTTAAAGSYYMYLEASSPRKQGDRAVLKSQLILSGGPLVMKFRYHMYGRHAQSLGVYIDGREVWGRIGSRGNRWHAAAVNISRQAGSGPTVEICFVAERGSGFEGDVAIDYVEFGTPSPGDVFLSDPAYELPSWLPLYPLGTGVCLTGEYKSEPATDIATCANRCYFDPRCAHFSFNPNAACAKYDSRSGDCTTRQSALLGHVTYTRVWNHLFDSEELEREEGGNWFGDKWVIIWVCWGGLIFFGFGFCAWHPHGRGHFKNLYILLALGIPRYDIFFSWCIWTFGLFAAPLQAIHLLAFCDAWAIGVAFVSVTFVGIFIFHKRVLENIQTVRAGRAGAGGGGGGVRSARVAPAPDQVPPARGVTSRFSGVKVFDEEQQADGDISGLEFPDYWTNARSNGRKSMSAAHGFDQMLYVNTGSHPIFDELLTKTYKPIATQDRPCPKPSKCGKAPGGCPCVRPGGDPGLPVGYVVRRVVRVEDSGMWKRYAAKRDSIRSKRSGGSNVQKFSPAALTQQVADEHKDALAPLEDNLNEVYLWHGTSIRTALAIAQNDFDISLAGSNAGTQYGRGAYLTECSVKADEYAFDEPGEYYDGVFALLLVRACLGKYYYTTAREPQAADHVRSGDCDSVLGDRAASVGTFREFVVYDADQVYPEYVVLYSRVHKADDESAVRAGAQMPFHMELPVYWSNCHMNPHTEAFAHQYRVRQQTLALLQRLASYTAARRTVTAVEAYRVEVSEMWNKYVDFKSSVEARDIPTRIIRAGKSDAGGRRPDQVEFERLAPSKFDNASDAYFDFCGSEALPAEVDSIHVSCEWKDQDGGKKQGRLRLCLVRGGVQLTAQDLFGVCRAGNKKGWKAARRSFSSKDPLVKLASKGDLLQVQYRVGAGGGHELHVKDLRCTAVLKAEDGSEDDGASKGKVTIARLRQPNELDGKEESGHALTSLLLDELDGEDCISSENLDGTVNEMFLWHGTSRSAAEAITASGFRIPRGGGASHGSRFGEGAYLAEDLNKSLSYTTPEAGIHYVLLCRAMCGDLWYTEERYQSSAHTYAKRDGKDSVLANPEGTGPREFIVLQECQVYPEFIVKLRT